MTEFIALLKSWGMKEVPLEDHGVPNDGTFWVFTDHQGTTLTVANNGEGYGCFFSTFRFDVDGNYLMHGSWE